MKKLLLIALLACSAVAWGMDKDIKARILCTFPNDPQKIKQIVCPGIEDLCKETDLPKKLSEGRPSRAFSLHSPTFIFATASIVLEKKNEAVLETLAKNISENCNCEWVPRFEPESHWRKWEPSSASSDEVKQQFVDLKLIKAPTKE
jgi:hypothetical protein